MKANFFRGRLSRSGPLVGRDLKFSSASEQQDGLVLALGSACELDLKALIHSDALRGSRGLQRALE